MALQNWKKKDEEREGTLDDLADRIYNYESNNKITKWAAGIVGVGQFSSGRIVVVTPDKTLQTVIEVPSPSAPNLAFGPDEERAYVMAVDEVNEVPYWGKVYAVDLE